MAVDEFLLDLVARLRATGFDCSITGGLACVEYGLVENTLDCDILFDSRKSAELVSFLAQAAYDGVNCQYRGNLSAPLDARWLGQGWTAHLFWDRGSASAYLDVFGKAPRAQPPWWGPSSPFAPRDTVAGMKRTQRGKDWSQATGLGLQMLREGDERGWLHIFDAEALLELSSRLPLAPRLLATRPVLRLVLEQDRLLERAVQTEIDFWVKLDRLRLRVFQQASKPYVKALRACSLEQGLLQEHDRRVRVAEELLPPKPLDDDTVGSLVRQAKDEVGLGLLPELISLLPKVGANFAYAEGAL